MIAADVALTPAEMWELSRVGGRILLALENMPENSPAREHIIEAGKSLFDVLNRVEERDDWGQRSSAGK